MSRDSDITRRLLTPWRSVLGRRRYAALGGGLMLLKYGLDRVLAAGFDRPWDYLDYWSPSIFPIGDVPASESPFYLALAALAIPFLLIGLSLTARRLNDAGLPLWLVALFFAPVLNVLFFALLCVLPSRPTGERQGQREAPGFVRFLPRSKLGSALVAGVPTAIIAVALTVLAADTLEVYGWGLFFGVPFALGLVSVLVYGAREPRRLGESILVGLISVGVSSIGLLVAAQEGAICLAMALPLTFPPAVVGTLVGWAIQSRGWMMPQVPHALCAVGLALPLLMTLEAGEGRRPVVAPVTSSVIVDAPPAAVWRDVVAFPALGPPSELVFRAGVAYPLGATIEGRGIGAVRRCRFSTGEFVEPITAWEAPRRLAFSVREQPPTMRELSPWNVEPPHLDGFLRSDRGEFRLEPIAGGRTKLTGTTWYENRMWPAAYWRMWSDGIISRIHGRVLRHVAQTAERREGTEARTSR